MQSSRALISLFVPTILFFFCSGCGPMEPGPSAYELAQGCYSLRSVAEQRWIVAIDAESIALQNSEETPGVATKFFIKPSALGIFLLRDQEGRFLSIEQGRLRRNPKASGTSEWDIKHLKLREDDVALDAFYTLQGAASKLRLLADAGHLQLQGDVGETLATGSAFEFVPQDAGACLPFPEASLDAKVSADFHQPKNPNEPVFGYADVHTHLPFPRALGGVAMSGEVFHRFGIEHALHDCSSLHGSNGSWDWLEAQSTQTGASQHNTEGYPNFPYWPSRLTNTHVQAYYRWIERAYLSGLRLMVANATGIPAYCQILGILHPGKIETDCKSDQDIESQIRYMFELEKYIDAQEGGPGRGWFKIVRSPREARQAIAQNKVAVVLGSEYGSLFDCTEGNAICNADYVERKLNELHALGVRSIFPLHRFDNAFGGTRPQEGSAGRWMNLANKVATSKVDKLSDFINPLKYLFKPIGGHYWQLENCPNGVEGVPHIRSMTDFIETDFAFLTQILDKIPVVGALARQILGWTFIGKIKPLPDYGEFAGGRPACNARPLQSVGRTLIQRIMDKGMILEIDHMSEATLLETLDMLEARAYSGVISSHDWIENTPGIRQRIFRLGGMMAPYNRDPEGIGRVLTQYSKEMAPFVPTAGVGIGTDVQGATIQASSSAPYSVRYPFRSIDGQVEFTAPKTGNRHFDFNKEGLAHYGLLPEWVEQLRLIDEARGTQAVEILMKSAESYLQMWERAEAQAVDFNQ